MKWNIDKKSGVAYLKLKDTQGLDVDCSDQEAGKSFIIDANDELIGFSFSFPNGWYGPEINKLISVLSNYFDEVIFKNNILEIKNKNCVSSSINSDIIIDFKGDNIFGFEFLFKPF